ncbi:response regulator [Petroclostridium sp. X23]|uniref:response regulator n=1 Tax=Petroclostridium sp. X23 TaxID=3045146 RepID=UPI0024AE31DC|nr:response regulator [Petroclostridium sp. X23]WHH61546.1 response regulator [Petroclostridium sp. X23]
MIQVLIVEDDPMVREINEKFLSKIEGYHVQHSVNSIEKAKEIIKQKKPDLILLDVFFPQGRGIDLLKWIRSENIGCDVILITADKNMNTVEEAFRYGVVDYLIKPFTFERFREALLQYKDRKNNLKKMYSAEQDIIDKYILNEKRTGLEEEVKDIKGFSPHTYKKIVETISDMKGETFTSYQIAKKVGVSRITARRYLDYLEKEQKVIVEPEYGNVGRPKNRYRLKED